MGRKWIKTGIGMSECDWGPGTQMLHVYHHAELETQELLLMIHYCWSVFDLNRWDQSVKQLLVYVNTPSLARINVTGEWGEITAKPCTSVTALTWSSLLPMGMTSACMRLRLHQCGESHLTIFASSTLLKDNWRNINSCGDESVISGPEWCWWHFYA